MFHTDLAAKLVEKKRGGETSGRFSISQFSLTTDQMACESIVVEGIDWFVRGPEERN